MIEPHSKLSPKMDTSTGYLPFVKMNRSKKYQTPTWSSRNHSFKPFNITEIEERYEGPLCFEFVNEAWQANFRYFDKVKNLYYYNDQKLQKVTIRMKDGDRLRLKYGDRTITVGTDVTIYYQEETLYWNLDGAIEFKEEQWRETEKKLRKQIADLQQQQQTQERDRLATFMDKFQEVTAKLEFINNANLEEMRKHNVELRKQIADLQDASKLQQDVKEREPSLQFPAILEQKKLQSVQIIEEISSVWERERNELNDKIAKLTRRLKKKQDQELLRKQAMTAITMLNQSLQQDQELEGGEDTDEEASVLMPDDKESVSESDIGILDNINCVICDAELGEDSVLEGFHRYCHQCANK